ELTTEPGGSTNFEKSISLATDELIRNGDPDKKQIEILLTDGKATKNVTRNTMSKVVNNNISIYTIGFGEEVDTQRLEWIANRTGGKYYTLNNSKGLLQMYQDISNREYTNSTGEDMHLEIEFKEYIDIEKNSFSVNPDNISKEQINTTIKWSFNKTFVLGDKWNVEFNISTEKKGKQSVYSNNSGIYYKRPWNKQENFTALPDLKIEGKVEKVVLLPPPPPPSAGATPPPVEAFPMPTSPMATTTIVPQAALQPIAQTAGYQALFAPLLGLGVGEVLKGKMSVEQKEGISMSSGKTPGEKEKEKEAKNLGYTFNER
ncbi:MAG: vWA domain-containing protein, partial [Thermoplasmatota archaeon]